MIHPSIRVETPHRSELNFGVMRFFWVRFLAFLHGMVRILLPFLIASVLEFACVADMAVAVYRGGSIDLTSGSEVKTTHLCGDYAICYSFMI